MKTKLPVLTVHFPQANHQTSWFWPVVAPRPLSVTPCGGGKNSSLTERGCLRVCCTVPPRCQTQLPGGVFAFAPKASWMAAALGSRFARRRDRKTWLLALTSNENDSRETSWRAWFEARCSCGRHWPNAAPKSFALSGLSSKRSMTPFNHVSDWKGSGLTRPAKWLGANDNKRCCPLGEKVGKCLEDASQQHS